MKASVVMVAWPSAASIGIDGGPARRVSAGSPRAAIAIDGPEPGAT